MKEEKVILVDRADNPVGTLPKMEAHEKGVLHRAFSVFILNKKGELMLQQRALHKYHSPGLWTNTCCSHQREGEENLQAGTRRLEEEMGFSVPLEELFSFIYKAPFDNGLTEHELDHVMLGYYEGIPEINSDEVNAWKWISLNEIASDLTVNPESYTVWFKIIFERFFNHIKSTK
jgi:isopentenyl-diphosphate Delta-isomerase